MKEQEKAELKQLEKRYEMARDNIEKRLKSNPFIIKNNSDISKYKFEIKIKDQKHRENTLTKLKDNNVPLKQKGKSIYTTLLGAAYLSDADLDDIKVLSKLEDKLKTLTTKTVLPVEGQKEYKWVLLDEELKDVYYFKSLEDIENAIQSGVIKKSYEIGKMFKWKMPGLNPATWEFPNTFKHFDDSKDNTVKVLIDGGDELAVAEQNSGLPDILSYGIQGTIIYPVFLFLISMGYVGAEEESIEIREELENNKNSKLIRELVINSLIREFKIKEYLKVQINKNKTVSAELSELATREAAIRAALKDVANTEQNLNKLQEESNIAENQIKNIISVDDIKSLSSNSFYQTMLTRGNDLIQDKAEYTEFVKNLSLWKQEDDKTTMLMWQAYAGKQLGKSGLSLLFWAMGCFEVVATLSIIDSMNGSASLDGIKSIFESGAEYTLMAGQTALVIYGLIETAEGINEVMSINEWIKKINKSKIMDEATKKLIISYLKSNKNHAYVGNVGGNTALSLGQMMMLASGFINPVIAIPGAGLTLAGIGVSFFSNKVKGEMFSINESLSKEELSILEDMSEVATSDFSDMLKYKVNKLKELSEKKEEALIWITIYDEIIKYCNSHKIPRKANQFDNAIQTIITNTLNAYSDREYFKNIKDKANTLLKETHGSIISPIQDRIKEDIKLYYNDRASFYEGMLDVVYHSSSSIMDKFNQVEIPKSAHTQYGSICRDIEELKKQGLWADVKRKLLRGLVIEKKSSKNIRGEHFERYIDNIKTKTPRYIRFPSFIPFLNFKIRNPFLPFKTKTIYIFNEDKFLKDLEIYNDYNERFKKVLDEILDVLLYQKKSAMGHVLTKYGGINLKSDVYRPLWREIPQLAYQEALDRDIREARAETVRKLIEKNNKAAHNLQELIQIK